MTLLDSAPPATSDQFRAFFRRHASGVSIVTAATASGPVGFTASSLASVSSSPPLISFNVSRTSSSWAALQEVTHVGVHRLSADDVDLAGLFARSGAARFQQARWTSDEHGVPVLHGPRSWLVASVVHRVHAGDSTVLIARILHVHDHDQDVAFPGEHAPPPLVYAAGRYAHARTVRDD